MKITQKHRAAADLIVAEQFSDRTNIELAAEIGVGRVSFQRWLVDPNFMELLSKARCEWRKQIEHIPLVHRRYRLEELQKLYDAETVTTAKAALMRQASEEVGGDVLAELEELRSEIFKPNVVSMRGGVVDRILR